MGKYRTTKRDRRQHGLGIERSVILRKYGGNLEDNPPGRHFSIVAIIPKEGVNPAEIDRGFTPKRNLFYIVIQVSREVS